jgi:hypothetical protein
VSVYAHRKSGKLYILEKFCRIKITDNWEEGIVYRSTLDDASVYVRSKKDFDDKFDLVPPTPHPLLGV